MKILMYTGDGPVPQTGMKHINLDKIHPTKQLDAIYKIIDKGEDVSITINDAISLNNINNLIILGNHPEMSIRCGYKGYYINQNDIKLYEFKKDKWKKVKLGTYGYQVDWYDTMVLSSMPKTQMCQELVVKEGETVYVN